MLHCPHCRNGVDDTANLAGQIVYCPFCRGQFQMPVPQAIVSQANLPTQPPIERERGPQNSPGLAAVLSFFYCGLGQIYNGDFGKALLFFLLYVSCYAASIVSVMSPRLLPYSSFPAYLVLVPVAVMIWLYGILDAFQGAEKYNRRRR